MSDSRGSDQNRTMNCSGKSRRTRDYSSRCWSSRTPTGPISTGSSTASGAGRTPSRWSKKGSPVSQVPVEITDRTLTDEERLRAWIYIHRQRKEWDAKEKEMVAYRLVELVGRASAANILGTTVRELDKLVQVFELSQRFTNLRDPASAITWARELMGVNKSLLTPSIVDAVVKKVARQQITNSKDLRKLRVILRDPVARAHFTDDDATIDSAMLRVAGAAKPANGLVDQLDAAMKTIRDVPWTELEKLRGDPNVVQRVAEAEELLRSLRLNLSS